MPTSSSLRKQGPITTGSGCSKGNYPIAQSMGRGVWVPAFAGTTKSFTPLRRVDPPKPVPHRGGGTGGQHRENPRVLIVAVERDPRQCGQMRGAFGKEHAGPRRHRSLESGRLRQREL